MVVIIWNSFINLILNFIGTEIMPKSGSTRIIASFWWLFCLICVASYTANLAAFLTKSKMSIQIKSADDLARQTDIKYGCYAGGSTRRFFSVSIAFEKPSLGLTLLDVMYDITVTSRAWPEHTPILLPQISNNPQWMHSEMLRLSNIKFWCVFCVLLY